MVAKSTIQAGERLICMQSTHLFWTCTEQRAMAILSPSSSRSIWVRSMTRLSAKRSAANASMAPSPLAAMDNLAQALRRGYRLARQRQLTRRALLDLEAAELKDIGLSAEQAREEASLAFWQAGKSGGRKA